MYWSSICVYQNTASKGIFGTYAAGSMSFRLCIQSDTDAVCYFCCIDLFIYFKTNNSRKLSLLIFFFLIFFSRKKGIFFLFIISYMLWLCSINFKSLYGLVSAVRAVVFKFYLWIKAVDVVTVRIIKKIGMQKNKKK